MLYLNRLSLIVFIILTSDMYGQRHGNLWEDRWDDFLRTSKEDITFLHRRYYHDTVSVEEMKDAFLRYRDVTCENFLYEGFDSLSFPMEGHGNSIMLVSPLKHHSDNQVRKCRGVWSNPFLKLVDLVDENGMSQPKLVEKLNKNKIRQWLDGEILLLEEPRSYMGFVVSPCLYWSIYDQGKLLANVSTSTGSPDFFSHAEVTSFGFGGHWDRKLQSGARLMGAMCNLEYLPLSKEQECTFSVLLYQTSRRIGNKDKGEYYTIELLEPESAGKDVQRLFQDLKLFVENLPDKTFKPYYTTDYRIMTGRYYRVTVSKCGWLIEDYLLR